MIEILDPHPGCGTIGRMLRWLVLLVALAFAGSPADAQVFKPKSKKAAAEKLLLAPGEPRAVGRDLDRRRVAEHRLQ